MFLLQFLQNDGNGVTFIVKKKRKKKTRQLLFMTGREATKTTISSTSQLKFQDLVGT